MTHTPTEPRQTTTEPRIAPLEPPYPPGTAELLRKWMPPASPLEPLALFRTLAVHDELVRRMRPLGAGILGHGRIAPRERELVILRSCARAGAEYEWGVHVTAFAEAVGLGQAQVRATALGTATDPAFSPRERLLIALVDELHDRCDVSAELWSSLAGVYGPDQLLELVITAGWYRLIAYVIAAARVPLEPWAVRFPS